MATGESIEGLRKIIDITRKGSVGILCLHFYHTGYGLFCQLGACHAITDRLLAGLAETGLFASAVWTKGLVLFLLCVSLLGSKGKKKEDSKMAPLLVGFLLGSAVFLSCHYWTGEIVWPLSSFYAYMAITSLSFLAVLSTGARMGRVLFLGNQKNVFNHLNETFPQEERLLENEYSVNLPACYKLKNKVRASWINIINPFRALLVAGTPGSGKSYFVIRHVIAQHIQKGFSMFIYDYKYDDLSIIAYNTLLKNLAAYKEKPRFYTINFDRLSHSHRCNPLEPETMLDITDASEAARTIMMGLNREWIKKQGDFFVESPINFLTAVIWFLKKHQRGKYCTLPHVIELMLLDYADLFTVLRTEPEIEALINPFVSAFEKGAKEQLEGQIASAKITMARLSSPQLYYVLSDSEFSLDINDPKKPKILCVGNNPQKQQVYGAVLSLYISRITKLANKKGKLKSSLIFDEYPTIYFNGMDNLIATARSNKVATCLGIQDYSQLKKDYGREQAEVIMNTVGNIVSGQVLGDTAKQLSERFGKIMQDRTSLSINSNDTSISKSRQLDMAVPASTIASLSSGEFVGMVADNPDERISHKMFHAEIQNDHAAIARETAAYIPIPKVRDISTSEVEENYHMVKKEVQQVVKMEIDRIMDTPSLEHLLVGKRKPG
ncbi:conjugal transfer protein MobC [Echinicola rosea]|uniref:Conjugal transfer protein TraG n=1 Tax=Echinicola rosea TaxID=1807691 RepID=A0ABQ1VB23_9BACT|nr:conjugal transfer protein MobC [Echinicola rosea]GGF44549.1 conjugal transfer protein TraG [Echinicola rosea]